MLLVNCCGLMLCGHQEAWSSGWSCGQGGRSPGYYFWLTHWLPGWPWTTHLTSSSPQSLSLRDEQAQLLKVRPWKDALRVKLSNGLFGDNVFCRNGWFVFLPAALLTVRKAVYINVSLGQIHQAHSQLWTQVSVCRTCTHCQEFHLGLLVQACLLWICPHHV